MDEEKENQLVTKVLSDLFADLITSQKTERTERITEVLFSQELRPAFAGVVFAWLQSSYKKRGDLANFVAMGILKDPIQIIFDMGICLGFSLAGKENPFTYADDFVRCGCEKMGLDFQAVTERIRGKNDQTDLC